MLRRKRLADLPEHWDFGELTPGAQVRVRRSGYYHHGIYIGNGQIISNICGTTIDTVEGWTAYYGFGGWGWGGAVVPQR